MDLFVDDGKKRGKEKNYLGDGEKGAGELVNDYNGVRLVRSEW